MVFVLRFVIHVWVMKISLKERVERFLPLDSMVITAKAAGVMTDHEKVFNESVIFTDLRPVFKSDASETPFVALVIHNLRIEYRENRELRKAIFAMDDFDLLHLKKVIDRALQKAESVKNLIKKETILLEPES